MEVGERSNGNGISPQKLAANRRNAQLSTGPRTEEGKRRSRRNALKHGVLASALLITEGEGAEDPAEFNELLDGLRRDLAPVGNLEEMLVEKIAVCWWRQKRVLSCEAGLVRRAFVPNLQYQGMLDRLANQGLLVPTPERDAIKDHLRLPSSDDVGRILRYETANNRQLVYAINQLERLQRARRGEQIPAPVSFHVSAEE
jgi:hypothetical protein